MKGFHALLAALAAATGAFALAFTWQPGLASMYDDSVSYLIQAQALSPFGMAHPAVLAAAPYEKYPPLFAALLALTGGAFDWRVAHAVVALAFAASVYLLGVLARQVTGSAWIAVATALVYAWIPGSWLSVKGILSEFPYMVLAFAALIVHGARAGKPLTRGAAIGLGALLAAAVLTRTIGITLLAAIAFVEALRYARERDTARVRALAWTFAIPIVAAALWYALRPSVGEDAYVSFGTGVLQGTAERGVGWAFSLVATNASALAGAWLHALLIFWGESWKPGFLIASAFGALGLAASLRRAARGHADAAYVAAFLGLLLVWPFPGQMFRLAFPLVPLVLMNAFGALRQLFALRWDSRRAERWSAYAAGLPIALAAPAVLFYIADRAFRGHGSHPQVGSRGCTAHVVRAQLCGAARSPARRADEPPNRRCRPRRASEGYRSELHLPRQRESARQRLARRQPAGSFPAGARAGRRSVAARRRRRRAPGPPPQGARGQGRRVQ